MFFQDDTYLWNGVPLRGILHGTKLDGAGNTLVFFLLRSQSFMDAFSPIIDDEAALYIFDNEGRPLFSSGDDFVSGNQNPAHFEGSGLLGDEYFGADTIAAYSYSDYGLLYVSVMPKKAALRQVQTLRFLTLYLNIAAVFLSLGYAVFLAARNSRRLMGAFRLLGETSGVPAYHGGNTLNYLNNSVLQLINTNAMLRQDADTRSSILKSVFLDKLLSGFYTSKTEMYNFAEHAGIVLGGKSFCVVIINLDAIGEAGDARQDMEAIERLNTVKRRIFSALEEWLRQRLGLLYSQTLNRIGVFFFLNPEQQEYFREHITELLRSTVVPVCTAMNVKVRFTGSGLYQDIMGIREGYNQCRDYMPSAAHWENGDFKWIDILPMPRQNMFVYPADMEKKLINQLQNADLPGVEDSLSAIFNTNIRDGLLNETMLTMLYTLLQGTFLKALEGPLVDLFRDAVQGMDFTQPPGKVEAGFLAIAGGICEAFAKEFSEKIPSVKKEELITWVQEHFSEDNLTLTSAAKHFGFSETYFSQLFKETTGENFSTFLEITRLTNSQTLLRQYLKIEEAALRCGYKSTNTFRRAYKRHFGISPSRTR
jgi:AraC-like DNA-binding protein